MSSKSEQYIKTIQQSLKTIHCGKKISIKNDYVDVFDYFRVYYFADGSYTRINQNHIIENFKVNPELGLETKNGGIGFFNHLTLELARFANIEEFTEKFNSVYYSWIGKISVDDFLLFALDNEHFGPCKTAQSKRSLLHLMGFNPKDF